jgi:hypothetical protein
VRRIGFSDLFDGIGGLECRFSPRAEALSGEIVEIDGYLAPVHGEHRRFLLVAHAGECPDCSPTPAPAIFLPDFAGETGAALLTLRGTVSYGFAIDETGTASFLRLTGVERVLGEAVSSLRF